MTTDACVWTTNVFCVLTAGAIIATLSQRQILERAVFSLPLAHACLCILAGFAGWWWFATIDVMYADAALPLIANPIALHLFHSRAWADAYPTFGPSRWIHFLVLPSLIGGVIGCVGWSLLGWLADWVMVLWKRYSKKYV